MIGIGLGIYIAVLLTILVVNCKKGMLQVQLLNQTITEKLKTKFDVVNGMSVMEARKKYVRFKATLFEVLKEASPIISNAVAVALGGKKGSSGYREGR